MSKNKTYNVAGLGRCYGMFFLMKKKLGGAPANFAAHAQRLGAKSYLLTAVGKDLLGQKAIDQLMLLGIDTSGVQFNRYSPTGRVIVSLDSIGNPAYKIDVNSAWDHIQFNTPQAKIAKCLDAICFGHWLKDTLTQKKQFLKSSGLPRRVALGYLMSILDKTITIQK